MRRLVEVLAFACAVGACAFAAYGFGEYRTRMRTCQAIGAIASFDLNRGYSRGDLLGALAYLEMTIEYCEGQSLADRVKRKATKPKDPEI